MTVDRATRERWDALVTLARAARRVNGDLWAGKLREYGAAIEAADNEIRDKNRALKETAWRLDVLLTRGDFAEDDEPATRAWLHRVRLAWRGLRTYRRRR